MFIFGKKCDKVSSTKKYFLNTAALNSFVYQNYNFMMIKREIFTRPNQDDLKNMTKIFENDQKFANINVVNMTENVLFFWSCSKVMFVGVNFWSCSKVKVRRSKFFWS